MTSLQLYSGFSRTTVINFSFRKAFPTLPSSTTPTYTASGIKMVPNMKSTRNGFTQPNNVICSPCDVQHTRNDLLNQIRFLSITFPQKYIYIQTLYFIQKNQ